MKLSKFMALQCAMSAKFAMLAMLCYLYVYADDLQKPISALDVKMENEREFLIFARQIYRKKNTRRIYRYFLWFD